MSFADAIALRAHLVNVLSAYLGEWEDGSPRIHIKPPEPTLSGKTKADTTNQSEVECIIKRVASGPVYPSSAGQNLAEQYYEIELVNFADDTKLAQAWDAILADSKIVHRKNPVHQNATTQTYERALFSIYAPKMINRVEAF